MHDQRRESNGEKLTKSPKYTDIYSSNQVPNPGPKRLAG